MTYGKSERRTARGPIERFFDNHVRLIAAVSTILVIVCTWITADFALNGNPFVKKPVAETEGKAIPITYVHGLGEKNEALTWKDFEAFSYKTVSSNEYEEGRYEIRRYAVEWDKLTVTVSGYTDGSKYTGKVEYATVNCIEDFSFRFSLLEQDGFLSYLEESGILPEESGSE